MSRDELFRQARGRLLDEFDGWLAQLGARDDGSLVANASMFLDWRYSYSTGELDEYADGELAEFLLEWCPRKYSAPPDEGPAVARAVGRFVEFLHATDRLVGGAARAARLITLAEELAPEVYRAMGDPSNFGMAKSLFGGGFGDLGDLTGIDDPDVLQATLDRQMTEFNALPFDERKRMTDRFIQPRPPEPVELPFLHVPPPEGDVTAAAAAAPIVVKIEALRQYLGEAGKQLTANGHLKLADGRALVGLLDTGDVVDPVHGERTFTTTSTDHLLNLRFLVKVAKLAGAVRIHKGRLVPVKAWHRRTAVDKASAAFLAVVDEGALQLCSKAATSDTTRSPRSSTTGSSTCWSWSWAGTRPRSTTWSMPPDTSCSSRSARAERTGPRRRSAARWSETCHGRSRCWICSMWRSGMTTSRR